MLAASSCVSSQPSKPNKPSGQEAVVHHTAEYTAELSSSHVPDGSLVVVRAAFAKPYSGKLTALVEDKSYALYPVDGNGNGNPDGARNFECLFGIPHSHNPGLLDVKIKPEGMEASDLMFSVVSGNYPSETLTVSGRQIHPRKKDLIRIKRETPVIVAAVHTESDRRYWSGPFILPVDNPIGDTFGTKRVYNGELKSYHGGQDFKAPIGTPIHAAAAGVVVLAVKDFFSTGGTVMIDHGHGLITMYFHMSRVDVKKGQHLGQRDLLGLSGKSGRVTGPHLHWQCDIHGVKVNPMDLTRVLK
jgi:hypothetical protein